MGIAYTAMLTAFYVDNGPHLPLWDRLPALVFWLLPSAIAGPVIARAVIRESRRAGGRVMVLGASPVTWGPCWHAGPGKIVVETGVEVVPVYPGTPDPPPGPEQPQKS